MATTVYEREIGVTSSTTTVLLYPFFTFIVPFLQLYPFCTLPVPLLYPYGDVGGGGGGDKNNRILL